MQPVIWRQIYGITIWNLIIMMVVMFFGRAIFGFEYASSDSSKNPTTSGGFNKAQHYTAIFDTFVFLQLFNQINCRVVGPRDFNVFTAFFSNWIFILITFIIFYIQYSASRLGNLEPVVDAEGVPTGGYKLDGASLFMILFQTMPIDSKTFWTTFVWGSTVIFVSFMIKLTPQRWLEKLPVKINEDEKLGEGSKLVGAYARATNANKGDNNVNEADNNDADDGFSKV